VYVTYTGSHHGCRSKLFLELLAKGATADYVCWTIDEDEIDLATARGQFACYGLLIELQNCISVTKPLPNLQLL